MMGGFGMGFMWIIWVVVIIAIILLAKGYFSPAKKESEPIGESALNLLKKRYAQGEISREEFEEKKRDLM
jgi:putative membrane protein